jgi:hypothetical protein
MDSLVGWVLMAFGVFGKININRAVATGTVCF